MPRFIPVRSRLTSALFWSVIAAAFIGPGTVTTAAAAGSAFKLDLLWGITFATLGCLVLQEAAARITITSGFSLGEAIARQYAVQRQWVPLAVAGALVFGCAAYQAGNLLGAVAGLSLLTTANKQLLTVGVAGLAGLLLWFGSFRLIANLLGLVVALMGAAFVAVAFTLDFSLQHLLRAVVTPSFPVGGSWLLVGLIGTTIVPYNLFLGSGMGKGQHLGEMRFGLSVAVLLGGLISGAILLAGAQMEGPVQFTALAAQMAHSLGPWAGFLMGFGLFAAGFTSAVTAPLAAAVSAGALTGKGWNPASRQFRLVWLVVLGTGFLFGMADYRPVPIIILAQGLNGLLLPFITGFLVLVVNDPAVMPRRALNGNVSNGLMLTVVFYTLFLGLSNVVRAFPFALPPAAPTPTFLLPVLLMVALGLTAALWLLVRRVRRQ